MNFLNQTNINEKKTAFITGISGQDGSYLAEFLIQKNYLVHGIMRKNSTNKINLNELLKNKAINIHYGDVTDKDFITTLLSEIKPNEIYNLAAQSNVSASFDLVEETTLSKFSWNINFIRSN